MKKETKENYLEKPNHCPFCTSWDIEAGSTDFTSFEYLCDVTCLTCKKQWTDIYRLADVQEKTP